MSTKRGLQIKTNWKVSRGQLIGYIGDDDENGDGAPHLHFGMKLGKYDATFPGYCGTGVNKIFSSPDYSGVCSSSSGRFVRALSFMERVNNSGKNPYAEASK